MTALPDTPAQRPGEHWPIVTTEDRLRMVANMIRTANHPHDSRPDALKCIVARIHEDTVAQAIHSGVFANDPECYQAARTMAAGMLDGADMNVRMLILLGEVAAYYLAESTGEPVPAILDNALMEA